MGIQSYSVDINLPVTNVNIKFNMAFDSTIAEQGTAISTLGDESLCYKPGAISLTIITPSGNQNVSYVEALVSLTSYAAGIFYIRFKSTNTFLNIIASETTLDPIHRNASVTFFEIYFNPTAPGISVSGGGIQSTACMFSTSVSLIPIANVCFTDSTIINTDQGKISVKSIDTTVNTIYGNKIVAITKTLLTDSYLVKLEKDCIKMNCPSETIILSSAHLVLYNETLIPAKDIREGIKIPYDGQLMYNIVLDKHSLVEAHNLYIETLYPENNTAMMFKHRIEIASILV